MESIENGAVRAVVTINAQRVEIIKAPDAITFSINGEVNAGCLASEISSLSLTIIEKEAYLCLGPWKLGPLDDAASKTLAILTAPETIH